MQSLFMVYNERVKMLSRVLRFRKQYAVTEPTGRIILQSTKATKEVTDFRTGPLPIKDMSKMHIGNYFAGPHCVFNPKFFA